MLLAIHLEDDCRIDSFIYPLGEDRLLFNKMHRYGYKVLLHYNPGIVHLNAKSPSTVPEDVFACNAEKQNSVIWWRTQLVPAGFFSKIARIAAFSSLLLWQTAFRRLQGISSVHDTRLAAEIAGLWSLFLQAQLVEVVAAVAQVLHAAVCVEL